MHRLIILKTEIHTKIQRKIHFLADILQLRVLFSKAFGFAHPRLPALGSLFFPIFVEIHHLLQYRNIQQKIQITSRVFIFINKKTASQDLSTTGLEGCLPVSGFKRSYPQLVLISLLTTIIACKFTHLF